MQLLGRIRVQRVRIALGIDQMGAHMVLDHLGHQPAVAPRTRGIRCITFSQSASVSSARSIASTWPRMRRTRASSFCLSRMVWVIAAAIKSTPIPYTKTPIVTPSWPCVAEHRGKYCGDAGGRRCVRPLTGRRNMRNYVVLSLLAVAELMSAGAANAMTLTSPDIKPGGKIADEQVFNGWDCTGKNVSPALSWSGAPKGTKSFAVSVYDPDAPTGSGFWHWWVADLPADATGLLKGAGSAGLPTGAVQVRNDFSATGYGGPCPPKGAPHHYQITVYALDVDKLDAGASPAVVGFNVHGHTLAKATLVGLYGR